MVFRRHVFLPSLSTIELELLEVITPGRIGRARTSDERRGDVWVYKVDAGDDDE